MRGGGVGTAQEGRGYEFAGAAGEDRGIRAGPPAGDGSHGGVGDKEDGMDSRGEKREAVAAGEEG